MAVCYKCSAPFLEDGNLANDALCERCKSWLHCCANCVQYDEYAHNQCRETKAEFISDRLGKNECKFFKVKRTVRLEEKRKLSPRAEQANREDRAREGLDRLFKK